MHEAIEEVGAWVLYLPPDSPDLNTIEQVFAKVNALLRAAAARTAAGLTIAIEDSFAAIQSVEC